MVFELYLSKGVMRKSYCFRKEREREEEREKTDFSFFLWRLVDKDVVPGGAATIRHVEGQLQLKQQRGGTIVDTG